MARGYTLTQKGSEVQEDLNSVENKTIYDVATNSEDGLMSREDKRKLDERVPDRPMTPAEIDAAINF